MTYTCTRCKADTAITYSYGSHRLCERCRDDMERLETGQKRIIPKRRSSYFNNKRK